MNTNTLQGRREREIPKPYYQTLNTSSFFFFFFFFLFFFHAFGLKNPKDLLTLFVSNEQLTAFFVQRRRRSTTTTTTTTTTLFQTLVVIVVAAYSVRRALSLDTAKESSSNRSSSSLFFLCVFEEELKWRTWGNRDRRRMREEEDTQRTKRIRSLRRIKTCLCSWRLVLRSWSRIRTFDRRGRVFTRNACGRDWDLLLRKCHQNRSEKRFGGRSDPKANCAPRP